jgi:hypothetical protein
MGSSHRLAWLALVLLAAAPARAQAPVDLTWTAPPGCPDTASVLAEVERLLGASARREDRVRVRGTMVRQGPRLWLTLETTTREGDASRTLEGGSCEALAQAGALVIAMAIDPEAVALTQAGLEAPPDDPPDTERTPDEAPPPLEPDVASEDEPDPVPVIEPARTSDSSVSREAPSASAPGDVRFVLAAHALVGVGPLPSASPGASLALGVRVGPVELTASGAIFGEQGARLATAPTIGGTFGLAYARLRGCVPFFEELVSFGACLAIEGGATWGRGEGVPRVQSGTAPWIALAGGLEARLRIVDALALSVMADLQVPILRSPFELAIDGMPTAVHTPFEIGGVFGAGLVVELR